MKKEVEKFIRSLGCEPHYQGSTKTMFIDLPSNWEGPISFTTVVLQQFPVLPFKLTINR